MAFHCRDVGRYEILLRRYTAMIVLPRAPVHRLHRRPDGAFAGRQAGFADRRLTDMFLAAPFSGRPASIDQAAGPGAGAA